MTELEQQNPSTVGASATEMSDGEAKEPEQKEVLIDPRVYINAFPKCGTHLVEQMVSAICSPMPAEKPWVGTFYDHSWTTNWAPTRKIFRRMGLIADGTYAKGHCGYKQELEMFLWGSRIATLFIYRDPRDVAVSLKHHIIHRHGSHSHPEWYEALGDDGALMAVINGLTEYEEAEEVRQRLLENGVPEEKANEGAKRRRVTYQGVLERWNQYAGWLNVGWVGKFKFEDLAADRETQAKRMIEYIVNFSTNARGYSVQQYVDGSFDEAVALMVEQSTTGKSLTFRKGVTGEWRHEFKPEHVRAFKKQDRKWAKRAGLREKSWLVRLGYENDTKWGV